MSYKILWDTKASEDLEKLDENLQIEIIEFLESIKDSPLGSDQVRAVWYRGDQYWRLKLKDRNGRLDHRVFFKLEDRKIVFYGVFHRDDAYDLETEEELRKRID